MKQYLGQEWLRRLALTPEKFLLNAAVAVESGLSLVESRDGKGRKAPWRQIIFHKSKEGGGTSSLCSASRSAHPFPHASAHRTDHTPSRSGTTATGDHGQEEEDDRMGRLAKRPSSVSRDVVGPQKNESEGK